MFDKLALKNIIIASFAASDGWKSIKPKFIQRFAPLISPEPTPGINTNTSNATASASGGSYCDADSYAGGLAGLSSAEATIKNCYATGDATASSSGIRNQAYASGLVGRSGSNALTNNYRYDGQRTQVNGDSKPTNTAGTAVTIEQLNDPSFYTDMLGWDSTFWDLTDLDFKKGKHPTFLE